MTTPPSREALIRRVEELLIADLLAEVKDLIEKASDDELAALAAELEQELFQPAARASAEEAVTKAEEAAQKLGGRNTERKW